VEEEPGLFADAPVVVGRGGQGDYAWEMRAREGSGKEYWIETRRQNGKLFMGELFSASDRGRLVAWFHAAGKQVGHGTDFAGYPGGCR
jgi:hypothetical protein